MDIQQPAHRVTLTPDDSGSTTLTCSVCGPLGTHLLGEVAAAEQAWHQERHNHHSLVIQVPESIWRQLRQLATGEGRTVEQWTQTAITRAVA